MRIESLHLIAFAQFTNTVIDLSGGQEGLHIIYGANESGKSTSLRALRQVLYGIPSKSNDNFKHAHPDMKIGAVLKHSSGSQLRILRRKGNSKTLRKLDSETELLDEELLKNYLGRVNQASFENTFGIDHQTLVRGGQSVLSGTSELGQLLFSAGSGIADLRSVLAGLEKEQQELYVKGGSTRIINKRLNEYSEAKRVQRDAELPNSEWEKHDLALKEALLNKKRLDNSLIDSHKKLSRLKRLSSAIPIIAERGIYQNQLTGLSDVVVLPENFEDESRALLEQQRILRRELSLALQKTEALEKELSGLLLPQGILEAAVAIESLQQKLGSYRKAQSDRIGLEQSLLEEQERARICLRELGRPEDYAESESLRMNVQDKTRLRKLALEKRALLQAYSDAQSLRQLTELGLKQATEALSKIEELPDSERLAHTVKKIQQDAQNEERLIADRKKLEREFKQILLEAKKLQLNFLEIEHMEIQDAERLHETLHGLVLPEPDLIDTCERKTAQVLTELELLGERKDEAESALRELQCRLQELELKGSVPTEADLVGMRDLRDRGWRLVLKSWKQNDLSEAELESYLNETNAGRDLSQTFQWTVSKADNLADRLRNEADQVAQKVQLSAQIGKIGSDLADYKEKESAACRRKEALQAEWQLLWEKITERKLSFVSARNYLQVFDNINSRLSSLLESLEDVQKRSATIARSKGELIEALAVCKWRVHDADAGLAGLIEQSHSCLEKQRAAKQTEAELERELSKLQHDLARNSASEQTRKAELDSWAAVWHPAVQKLGLGPTTSPEELTAFLDRLEEYFSHYDKVSSLQRRIAAIVRDADEFHQEVSATCQLLKETDESFADSTRADSGFVLEIQQLQQHAPETAVIELFRILNHAKELFQRQEHLKKQKQELEDESSSRQNTLAGIEERLKQMLSEARIENVEELPLLARKSQEKRRLESMLENFDRQLARLSEDGSVDELIAECRGEQSDELDISMKVLEAEIAQSEKEKEELQVLIGSQKQILKGMDGGAAAADAAVSVQQVLSELGGDFEEYCRVRLAAFVLRKAIERYRRKNQSPILKRASEYFAKLSAGSFSALQEDYDEKGEPLLFGVRAASSQLVPIEGMSEGTCDQLYLSIRLAALSLYLDKEEALPFIVDDILVNFDDQRSLATLEMLAEFSQQTQIIMFTHHQHIVDLAKRHLSQAQVFVSDLSAASGALSNQVQAVN